MRLLVRGGAVLASGPRADTSVTAMAVEDGRIVWLGDHAGSAAYDGADEVTDVQGALVAPAFVDSHVHLVQTGRQLDGLNLDGATDKDDLLERVGAYVSARPADTVVIGAGWDETRWPDRALPTADELERVAPGRRLYLSRVDGHSAIVSHALLAETPQVRAEEGWAADGRLERRAKHTVSDKLAHLDGPEQRLEHARRAVAALAGYGVAAFHENAAPHIGPEYELGLVRRAAAEGGLQVTAYWGELGAFDKVAGLRVAGLAGDLVADGAVGSRTASLHHDYTDQAGHRGHGYLDASQIAEHLVGCSERGIQGGFHCIGDAALDAVAEGLVRAAERVGEDVVRAARHRLEHCEMPSPEVIAVLARLGVVASVQPMFDGLWGGPEDMYAERLGERWQGMNPFAALAAAGVSLAFGSDSPVTTPEPWSAVRAAVHHHNPEFAMSPADAFRAHTVGSWHAGGDDQVGELEVGAPATFAVWSTTAGLDGDGLPVLDPGADLPTCLRTVVDGRTVHLDQEAS